VIRARIDNRPVEASAHREGLDIVVELHGRSYAFRPRDLARPHRAAAPAPISPRRGTRRCRADRRASCRDRHRRGGGSAGRDRGSDENAERAVAPLKGRATKISAALGAAVERGSPDAISRGGIAAMALSGSRALAWRPEPRKPGTAPAPRRSAVPPWDSS
jgi:hypothetical protein